MAYSNPSWPFGLQGLMTVHSIAFAALGAVVGFAYQRFVGCRTGACPITANPYISTIYGAAMGFVLSGGLR